jgi:hypothetical protein
LFVLPALLGSPHIAFSPMIDDVLRMVRKGTSDVVSVRHRVYCEVDGSIIIDFQDMEGGLVVHYATCRLRRVLK